MKCHVSQAQTGLFINEFQASNYATVTDSDFNAFSDWIELYNANDFSIDIGGYYLTDDLQNNQKWQFPANTIIPPLAFFLVWCDDQSVVLTEYHTNFKLGAGGEDIGLYDQQLNLLDYIGYNEQVADVSFGRKADGTVNWFYLAEPSPGNPNTGEGYSSNEQSSDVAFSISSGFYAASVNLTLSGLGTNSEIRYTTDGSSPNQSSFLFSSAFPINTTTIVRARTYLPGKLPGKIFSQSYFISEETALPVISLIINPEFLWDPEIGIYVDENIEERTNWERSGSLEYYNSNHNLDFIIDANLRLFGNSAYYYPQKTLSVFPDSPLQYQLFQSKETEKFHSFLLRSSSDDWPFTMMRDALMHSIIGNQLKLDYQAYTPSVLFINGSYWGIHNIREKINERFLETYHNVDPDNLDLVYMDLRDTTITSLSGDLVDMNQLLTFIQNNDLSQDENFNLVKSKIDLDNYIDYAIAHIFYSNTSWHHNVKIWKEKVEGAKWQWLLYDLDRGMASYYLNLYSVIEDIDTTDLFFSHFNENNEFREQFLNRFCGYMNSTFTKTRILHFIDSIKDNIAEEIPEHSLRWKNECDPYGNCGIQSYEDWLDDINILKEYTNEAPEKVTQYVMDFFDIQDRAELTINIINSDKGKIYINGIEYKPESLNWTYFKGISLQIVAVPNTDQLFMEWTNVSYNDTLSFTLIGDTVLNAKFGDYCYLPSVITNDTILSAENCDVYFTQGNLTINPNALLTIEGGIHIVVSNGDSLFVNGGLIINGTEDFPVTIRSLDELTHWGCISASNAILNLTYTNFVNCHSAIAINGGELLFDHSTVHNSPYFFADIIAIHYAHTSISNSTFYGPDDSGKSDMIDCDEIPYGLIINNDIYGTTDDGIDIGTGSNNVEISGNRIYNCESMGISVGENSVATIERNIIVNCLAGIQVHSAATAHIDHNTLYNNEVSIRCYHYENEPLSGGNAIVINTILSASNSTVFELFENSTISFDYSLSDTDSIPGIGNLNADPLFVFPEDFDFSLQESSPCINAGNPDYLYDPDGTQTDIGAIFFDNSSFISDHYLSKNILIIPNPSRGNFSVLLPDSSEIIYSIEIFNASGAVVFERDKINNTHVHLINSFNGQGIYYVSILTKRGTKYNGKVVILDSKK